MNDDFIKSLLGGMDQNQLKGLIQSKTQNPEELMEMAKQFAPMALMLMDDFLANGGRAIIAENTKEAHKSAADFIATDLPMVAMMFKTIQKEEIEQGLAALKAQYEAGGVEEQVKNQRAFIDGITEDQHITIFETMIEFMPDRLQKFYMSLYDMNDQSEVGDVVRKLRNYVQNASDSELAEEAAAKIELLQAADIHEIGNDFASHFSANKAQTLADAFNKHVKPESLDAVATAGIDLTREFLVALSAGQDPDFKEMQSFEAFKQSIKNVLGSVEEAVSEADALPNSLKTWAANAKGSLLPPKP